MVGQRTRAQWHYTSLSVLATLATVSAGGIPNLADYRSKLSAAAKKNQADTASPVRRRLGECEDAYALCIADSGCASCVSMLSLQDDDDLISSGSCDAITSSSIYACSSLGASSATLLCDLADACVTGDDGDDGSDDDDATGDDDEEEPCPTDACEVAHPSWLGDGWCDYDYGSTRCYNTEACGFDGGDCCEESCVSSTYLTCGLHGYQCYDPENQPCAGESCTMHMYDSFGDGWNGAEYIISEALSSATVAEGTLESGAEATDEMCLNAGCYIISVSAGTWSGEISWEFDIDDTVTATDGAPATCHFSVGGSFCDDLDDTEFGEIAACSAVASDDGSGSDDGCSASGEGYELVMHDTNGAGWNGVSYTLSTHASASVPGTVLYTGSLAAGYQSTESLCLEPGCYTMVIEDGDLHHSWQIGKTGTLVAEGVAPVNCDFSVGDSIYCETTCTYDTTCPSGQTAYIFAMHDKGADGWDGNSYTIYDASGSSVTTGTLSSGAYGEDNICLDDSACYSVSVGGGGSSGSEIYWQLGNADHGEIASGEYADSTVTCDFSTPATDPSDTSQCQTRTCFDLADDDDGDGACGGVPGAGSQYELVLYDSAGDGWDGATYSVNNVYTGATIASGSLDEGQQAQENMCLPIGCYEIIVTSGAKDAEVSWFIGDADLSGGAPANCQFNVGPPNPSCMKQCFDDEDDEAVPKVRRCTTAEKLAGAVVVDTWSTTCTDPQIKEKDWEDKDLTGYDWQELDDFEECAFNDKADGWPDSCMALQVDAENSDDALVSGIATNLEQGSYFCSCVDGTVAITPNCRDYQDFLELLRESGEACDALDAVDCAYLEVFVSNCLTNLVNEFGVMDLSNPDQCVYVDDGCGGLPQPIFRNWDCLDPDQLTPAEATFLASYQQYCLEDDGDDKSDDGSGGGNDDMSDSNSTSVDDMTDISNDDSSSEKSSDSGSAAGAAVGIVFAILAVVGCVAGAMFYLKKRRANSEGYHLPDLGMATFSPMTTDARTQQPGAAIATATPTDFRTLKAELETPPNRSSTASTGGTGQQLATTGYIPVELE